MSVDRGFPDILKFPPSVAHIKKRDGFLGCYRGLTPKLAANIVSGVAFQRVTENIQFKVSVMLLRELYALEVEPLQMSKVYATEQ